VTLGRDVVGAADRGMGGQDGRGAKAFLSPTGQLF